MIDLDFSSYDRALAAMGLERTRENYLWLLYDGNVPEMLDEDDETNLPPDLRLSLDTSSDT